MSRTEQAARLLRLTRLDALARRTWSGLLIFNYHRFGRPGAQDDPDLYSATLDDFATHVAELADRFEIVPAGSAEWSEGGPPAGSPSPSTTVTATSWAPPRCSPPRASSGASSSAPASSTNLTTHGGTRSPG
ncbi:hypothetical protein ACFQV8_27695 [Pseudonocardia benzenivorans]